MKYSLKHQRGLDEKLSKAVLAKLFEFIESGDIDGEQIRRMSYEQNMNLITTFNECERRGDPVEVRVERMLDRWYEKHLYKLTTPEAVERILKIVDDTCSPMVAFSLRQKGK